MKNIFLKSKAKSLQKTGGGDSQKNVHHLGVASEMPPRCLRDASVSIYSCQSDFSTRVWKYAACLLLAFVLGIGQMWGTEVTFSAADLAARTKRGVIQPNCSTSTSSKQLWHNGSKAQKYDCIPISSAMGTSDTQTNAVANKDILFTADAGYKITGISIVGASNSSSTAKEVVVCWTGDISNSPASFQQIELVAYNGGSMPTGVSVSSIPNGTKSFGLYNKVKVNDATTPTALYTGSGCKDYGAGNSHNVYSVTVTYEAVGGVTQPSFSPVTGGSMVKSSGTVALTSSENTVYYKWSQTDNQYASDAGATLAGAADGSGTSPVNATAPSTAGTWYLYAVAYDGDAYSNVVKATYTITNPTHILTWELDGGTATGGTAAGAVAEGATLTAPTVTKDGYDFAGWSPNVPSTMPSDDATYTATWTKAYAIGTYQFDGNATLGTDPSKTVTTTASNYAAFRIDNLFFSTTKIEYETDASAPQDADNYWGWKIKYNGTTNIKFYVEENSDVEVSIGSIGSNCNAKISYTDHGGTAHNNTAISANTHQSYEAKAGTMVTIALTADGSHSVALKRIKITSAAPPCTATVPGDISKGTATGGTGTITLTADGSPASGDTWYWQSAADGTDKTGTSGATKSVNAAGTYYLRSYNTGDCWSTAKSVTVVAADLLTAITPTLSYDANVIVENTLSPTLSGNAGSGTVTYTLNDVTPAGSLTITPSTGVVTAVTVGGTATVTATIAANGNYAAGAATSGTITVIAATTKRIYLKCGSTWCDASPKFFVHSWGSVDNDAELVLADCETDVYYADIPVGNTSLLFTRQKSTTSAIIYEGDDFWGKSQNITIGDNDLFTCTGWSDGLATFSGSTYAAPTYSISFAGNGNTDGEMSAISSLACGANQAITANAFVKAGYSFANWTADVDVTVGGETVSAGSAIANQATIQNITGNITLTAAWTQEMPTSVSVDGGWRYFPGQAINLTATPIGGTSGFTYQWQKYVTDAWQDIEGANEDTYTKANCTISDCGSYRCVVSKLGGSVASGSYDVHIYTLNGNYDGSDWVSNNLTLVSGTSGKVELDLAAGRLYKFKVKDNFANYYFGNSGYMLKSSEESWACPKDGADIRVFTGAAGTYTFTVDIANTNYGTPEVAVSVTYPSVTHPIAGYVYYDKGSNDWENVAAHWWKNEGTIDFVAWNSDPWLTQSVEICGKTYYYMPKLEGYDRLIFHKPSASGDGNQTPDITVDASSSGKYISGNVAEWKAFAKYTISFAGNGNTSGEMSAIENICPASDQALTANAFAKTGHNFTGWVADVDVTVGESTITAGNLIEDAVTLKNINSNIALTAQWESNCPATGTLFAISSIVASQTYSNVKSSNMVDLSATYTNGSAKVGSTGNTNRTVTTSATGELSFSANGDVCVKLLLDCELAEGDIIFYTSSDNKELRLYATSGGSYVTTAAKSYTIPAESPLIGKQELWILRDNSASLLKTLTISRPATITLDATTNGGTAVDPVSGIVGNKVVLPHAFKSGKRFKGWYTDASAGTKQADYYTVSASTTLYAQFEDIPASGTMFSLALEDALKPAANVTIKNAAGFVQPQDMIQYATVSGGSAIVYNSSTSDHAVITTTPTLKFAGGNAYLLITFESALQEGDVITTTISGQNISYTTTSTRSTANNFIKGTDQTLTITDGHALEGATAIYLWAASSSNGELTSLVVERPTTYALAWDFGGGTCSATAGEDYTAAGSYVAGTAITYPADNTMSRDDYTFAGWSSDATVMPSGNLTITAQWTAICYATAPGTISKGTVSSGTLTLNAAGSPADNNTWYWQTSESGTSTANSGASFDVTAAGTYYVRSYYSTGDCWSDALSIVVEADDLLEHYAITYDKGANGTGSIEPGAKIEDVAFTLSAERFTRAGYVQTGWATTDGGAQAYALGASYTANAAITLFPVWTALDTYEASFACADAAPAGWTFSTDDGWADNKTIAAYVCKFTENDVPAPGSNGMDENWVAFAKSADATATYDLGVTTTVAAMNATLYGGSGSAFNETIEYVGADGTTVKQTYVNSLSAGNWLANNINKTDVVADVRYIRVHGAGKWVVMKDFSIQYIETRAKYDVNFAAGTGASGSMDAVQYIAGAEVTLPACTFTAPTGKEFDAWVVTKTAGGDEVSVTDGKFTMPAEAVTATATWKDEITRYTVAYYDGASKLGEEDVIEGENPVDFADYQTKEGYNFVGWYNNADLANEHAVADIASEAINADANYYGKWALNLQVTKIVFSNGFEAFIQNNSVKAYYMAGESAPTITSYEGTNLKAEGGVTIDGDNIVLIGTDDSEKEMALTLEAVTPMTSYDKQTFDGTEDYVKTGYTFDDSKKWRFSRKDGGDREIDGRARLYFFVGGGADKVTFTSATSKRAVKVYVNNVLVSSVTETASNGSTFDIPLDPNDTKNMIAFISNQGDGDGGVGDMKLNEHIISSDASLSSLTVNGNAVDLASGELVAGVMTYKYELPYGTEDAPTVAAVANNEFASLGAITQAASTTGTATFTVTAEDASTQDYAVKFHVSLNPKFVIYDGSTMSDYAESGSDEGTGFAWTVVGGSHSAKNIDITLNGKTYTKAQNIFGSPTNSTTRYIEITIPEGYMAKFYLAGATNNGGDLRSSYISKEKTGTLDESIAYASTSSYDGMAMQSDFQPAGTYYYCCNASIRLYELSIKLYHIDHSREVGEGLYGTICLPNGGIMVGATIYEVAHMTYENAQPYKLFFDEVLDGVMEAGMPYIFMPKEGVSSIAVTYTDEANAPAGSYNGLHGTLDNMNGTQLLGKYIFYNNMLFMSENEANWLNANRAYIQLNEVPDYVTPVAPNRRRVSMGFNGTNSATGIESISDEGLEMKGAQKMLINGKIYILRGEKMYDATGRLVK